MIALGLSADLGRVVSKGKARKLIVAGAVYLNGNRVRIASKSILPRAKIEVYLDEAKLLDSDGKAADLPFVMTAESILFEDDDLICVNKPPGLPTQPTLDEARANLFHSLKRFLSERSSTDAYVGLHHRLDRDTSGVILFTKRKEANFGVAELFKNHEIQKTYLALSSLKSGRAPQEKWRVKNFLGKSTGKRNTYQSVRSGGDPAITDFKRIWSDSRLALIEAMPLTGRTHQIRIHLSEDGFPILGDATYGGIRAEFEVPRLLLHARRLTFKHPISNKELAVESPIPEDFLQCLPQHLPAQLKASLTAHPRPTDRTTERAES